MQTLSDNLKKLRIQCGLTMDQVAKEQGITRHRYEHWENRNIEPPLGILLSLARFYNITVDELINSEPESKMADIYLRLAASPDNIKKAVYTLLEL